MVKIQSSVSIKINTGNFESMDFSKSVEVETKIDPEKDVRSQISEKSKRLNALVIQLLKDDVESTLTQLGRARHDKEKQKQIGIWELL